MGVRDLTEGKSGADVRATQQGLNMRRPKEKLKEDGVFGPKTDHAVREHQDHSGLKVDGTVGHKTRKSLFGLGVATVTVVGRRPPKLTSLWPRQEPAPPSAGSLRWRPGARSPKLLPGELHLDFNDLNGTICNGLCANIFRPRYIWPLPLPVPMPALPDWDFSIRPLPSRPAAPSKPLGFVYDHLELQPGEQSTFPFGSERQDAFVLTMQSIYRRGPEDGPNVQSALGVQIGVPLTNGPWTFNPFIQLTDVDRLGALGRFHYWQPYAQLGIQMSGPGAAQPTLTTSLFPFNFTLNMVKDALSLNLGAGFALNLDLQSGRPAA
jgi:peptidoglycan hydrolase-like protein with peptidoglycan-binding domain